MFSAGRDRISSRNRSESQAGEAGDGAHAHPLYYDTVWDLWRLVDVLEKRDDVDAKRIGMMGISMGGIETWLAAGLDRVIVGIDPQGAEFALVGGA